MTMLRNFLILMCAWALSACATTSVKPEDISSIKTGEKSGIIMSYLEYQGFYSANVSVVNTDTGSLHNLSMHGGSNWVGAGPDMVAVEPGNYRIWSGSLGGYQVSATMPLVRYWFEDFDVGPGEIVDVGTLNLDELKLESTASGAGKVWNTITQLGDSKDKTSYITYTANHDDDARVQKMMADKFPELVGKPVKRQLVPMVDRAAFEKIIADANQPGPDGKLPSTEKSRETVSQKLIDLFENSQK